MPSWQPNWQDVEFDHGKCEAAVAACIAAASQLEAAQGPLDSAATEAQVDWTGNTVDEFRTASDDADGERESLAEQLRDLASSLEAGAEAATAEQTARENDRERWRQQRDAERAAAGQPVPV